MNKKLKSKKRNTNKGITLIALIITIIVLLILAVVAIRAVSGDGILAHAKNARDEYQSAQTNEQSTLQNYTDLIENELGTKPNSGDGETPDQPQDPTLNVMLKVTEKEVTETVIPISVDKVTKKEDDSEVTEGNLTYTWSYEGSAEYKGGNSHRFENLNPQNSYTLKCKVEDTKGDWGIGEVTVISFSIHNKYYRATNGMTWSDFISSGYDITPPNLDGFGTHDHETTPEWSSLTEMWDNQGVAFICEKCKYELWDDGIWSRWCGSLGCQGSDVIVGR